MKLLIVDDHPADRELLRAYLEGESHTVVEAVDGVEALRLLSRERVDAVISDILMPNMDGFQLCLEVRKSESFRALPFIIRTGTYTELADRRLAASIGADCYLLKSTPAEVIFAALREIVGKAGEHREAGPAPTDEATVFKQYNAVLVAKLESKNAALTRANEELRAGEERFRQLAENIREVFWLSDPAGDALLYVSPAYETVWGRTPDSLYDSPRAWLEAVHPEDRERVSAAVRTKRITGTYDEEYRIIRPDGTLRWIRDRAFRVRNATGGVYRIAGVAEDITERKRLEEQSQETAKMEIMAAANERLQSEVAERRRTEDQIGQFFTTAINLHCVAGFDGRFKRLNPAWERLTGFTTDELMTMPYLELVHPEDRAAARGEVEKLGRGGATIDYEQRLRCKDGTYRWTLWSAAALLDQQVFLASGHDITGRKQAEAARSESEAQLQAFIDNSTALIFMKDTAGRYLHVNFQFLRMFQVTREQVLGKTDQEIFPAAQAAAFQTADRKVFRSGRPLEVEEAAQYGDGPHVSLVSKFPLRNAAGQVYALCGIATDITARKRAERELRQMAGRLLRLQDQERRVLGHELHDTTAQGLAALEINLTALRKLARHMPAKSRELLRDSVVLAARSAREIRTLSYTLRPPLLEEMGLSAALRTHVRGFASRSGIKCRLTLPRKLGRLPADLELALFRIVQEALANVHRHAGSKVATIRLRQNPRRLVLEIADQGQGMPASAMENFLAAKATLGIGLAGMRERARQLGGDIVIRSTPGDTRVRAELPSTLLSP